MSALSDQLKAIDSATWLRPPDLGSALRPEDRPEDARPHVTFFSSGATHSSSDIVVRLRLADSARQEAKRRRLLELLSRPEPLWDAALHPELEGAGGAAAWVKKLRGETEQAFGKRTRSEDDG